MCITCVSIGAARFFSATRSWPATAPTAVESWRVSLTGTGGGGVSCTRSIDFSTAACGARRWCGLIGGGDGGGAGVKLAGTGGGVSLSGEKACLERERRSSALAIISASAAAMVAERCRLRTYGGELHVGNENQRKEAVAREESMEGRSQDEAKKNRMAVQGGGAGERAAAGGVEAKRDARRKRGSSASRSTGLKSWTRSYQEKQKQPQKKDLMQPCLIYLPVISLVARALSLISACRPQRNGT